MRRAPPGRMPKANGLPTAEEPSEWVATPLPGAPARLRRTILRAHRAYVGRRMERDRHAGNFRIVVRPPKNADDECTLAI